jgi:hypothetical protein
MPSKLSKKPTKSTASTNKSTKRAVWAILLLLLLVAVIWAMWTPGKDPQIAKIQDLRAKMEDASGEQRDQMRQQLREEFRKLSPEARRAMFAERWQQRERNRMGEFFAMSYAEQIAAIDKDIDRQNERRKRWEQRQAQDQQSNSQSQNGGNGNGGRGGGWGGGTPQDRLQRQKAYLDNTTPIEREQRAQYRQLQQQRRTQRGV